MLHNLKINNYLIIKMSSLLFCYFAIAATVNAQQTGTFTDMRDGKVYKTVKIGNQTWMAENLNYNGGSGSWCYDDDSLLYETYGRLYNWSAASTACPEGWHLPSDSEWNQLVDFLGGKNVAGVKLKSTNHWKMSKLKVTNSAGFSALPGGRRQPDGSFDYLGTSGVWWSSTIHFIRPHKAWFRYLYYSNGRVTRSSLIVLNGYSVRCVKDELPTKV